MAFNYSGPPKNTSPGQVWQVMEGSKLYGFREMDTLSVKLSGEHMAAADTDIELLGVTHHSCGLFEPAWQCRVVAGQVTSGNAVLLPEHLIGKTLWVDEGELKAFVGMTPEQEDSLGMYKVIHSGTGVTSDLNNDSREITKLGEGELVNVQEVVVCPAMKRVRGLIENPFGWISLLDTEDGYRWVRKQHDVAVAQPSLDVRIAASGLTPFFGAIGEHTDEHKTAALAYLEDKGISGADDLHAFDLTEAFVQHLVLKSVPEKKAMRFWTQMPLLDPEALVAKHLQTFVCFGKRAELEAAGLVPFFAAIGYHTAEQEVAALAYLEKEGASGADDIVEFNMADAFVNTLSLKDVPKLKAQRYWAQRVQQREAPVVQPPQEPTS